MKPTAAAILEKPALPSPAKLPLAVKRLLFFLAIATLFTAEILRVWFLMPFPGSQVNDTVTFAWWLDRSIGWIRAIALIAAWFALIAAFKKGRTWEKIALPIILLAYVITFLVCNFRLPADKIFYQPINKLFATAADTTLDRSKLVIGVVIDGQAKAYPIQLIGYHHQVLDTVGNTPVMVTYCTVCRSARIYSPFINGRQETFRLVGMDHYNAVFEDATTNSWWQQATGVAITGPLKGAALKEFPSEQMTLEAWLRQQPASLVMKPDTLFMDHYFKLEDYDKGTMRSPLVRRDTTSWQHNSWVVGIPGSFSSRVYDWNRLLKQRIIQDSVDNKPVLVTIERDSASFHVYDRRIDPRIDTPLSFTFSPGDEQLTDENTRSTWTLDGLCIGGPLKGKRLHTVQSYNEFWHSWQTFHKEAKMDGNSD